MAILHQLLWASYPSIPSGYDSDSQAYFDAVEAAGVTLTSDQKGYVDTFVSSLKSASIWTPMIGIYPYVGGTAAVHAINLRSPGTHNITWSGTLTHSSSGVTGDGATGYGNPGVILSATEAFYGSYLVAENGTTGFTMAARDASNNNNGTVNTKMQVNAGGTVQGWHPCSSTPYAYYTTSAREKHLWSFNHESSGSSLVLYDGTSSVASMATIAGIPTRPIYLFARNNVGTAVNMSAETSGLMYFGSGLSSSQVADFASASLALMNALGRNV